MKVFTDQIGTSFFKTDNYIKNLRAIEINSIKEFVSDYALDPYILLGVKDWMVGRFDELQSGLPQLDLSDEPSLHGNWLDIDFVKDFNQIDILCEIEKYVEIDSSFLEELKDSSVFLKRRQEVRGGGK